ncbi:lasso RiPP family leader peptide-containing protein [Spirosoma panaciterrae]
MKSYTKLLPKKAYQKPKLVKHGKVNQITLHAGS